MTAAWIRVAATTAASLALLKLGRHLWETS